MKRLHAALRPLVWLEALLFRLTPRIALTDPFQVVLAVGLFAVGVVSLVSLATGDPSGIVSHALNTDVLRFLWGASLVSGALGQVFGLQRGSRDAERFGMVMTMLGCTIYALACFGYASTLAGSILGFMFLAFAAGYWIVLRASSRAKRLMALMSR